MSVLDADRVNAALGERLGNRFRQYAEEADVSHLLVHIDEHLAQVARRPGADLKTAAEVARGCKQLLIRTYPSGGRDTRAAIAAVVRYFIETHDMDRDDEPLGFADDALVLRYVIGEVAPELL